MLPRKFLIFLASALLAASALLSGAPGAFAEDAEYDGYLVKFDARVSRSILSVQEDEGLRPVPGADGLYLTDDPELAGELENSALVEYVEPNYILEVLDDPVSSPDDTLFAQQWTLEAIDYLSLYAGGYDGSGVTVAVIDSGLYAWQDAENGYQGHEDFEGVQISDKSRNFLGTADEETRAPFYYREQKKVGHGTFVTGRIAAATNNGLGLAGIAGNVKLMILRCISAAGSEAFPYDAAYDANSGSVAVVASAIRYAADNGADVINISLGSTNASVTLQDAVDYADEKGVIVVAASGNSGGTALFYPAADEHVIGVGSVGLSAAGEIAVSSFSQHNTSVSAAAPGGAVLGAAVYPNGDGKLYETAEAAYASGSGTSYASPVVAALAAVVKQVNRALDHDDFEALLAVTAQDYGSTGWDAYYGYGVPNAGALLRALTETAYPIAYVLCDGGETPAQLPEGCATTYTLNRTAEVVLPTPTRTGYVFEGWYASADYSGEAADILPAGTLGPLSYQEADGEISYSVGAVTYYAKWSPAPAARLTALTVLGYPASQSGSDENTYAVTLPLGSVAALSGLTSTDIKAETDGDAAVTAVADSGGAAWTVTVTPTGGTPAVYSLSVTLSGYAVPTVAPGAEAQAGAAYLPSLDGQTAAVSYTAAADGWFVGGASWTVISCDGGGTAGIDAGGRLTYAPGGTDYAGRQVTVMVGAENPDFTCPDTVTVTVSVGRAASNAVITPVDADYDLYADASGLEVEASLYDNTLSALSCGGSPIPESGYTVADIGESGDMGDRVRITLTHALLEELGTGQKVLLFHFSAGADQSLTLTVADSAPRRTVSFYLDAADSLPYCRAADIRDGGVLGTLPPQPTKEGYLFTGWYLSDGTTRITADTVVRADVSVYAAWSSSSGPAGGGGLGGGGGAASDEGDAVIDRLPAGAAVYDAETVSALLRGGAVLLEDGGAGVALSGAAAQAAAEAGAEVTVSGTAGRLTLSPGLLAALDAGDADQIFLIVEPAEAPSDWLEAAGFSSADVAVSVRLRILIYTAEGEPAAVQLQEPARLALRAGTEFADRSLSVLSGEPGAAASAEEVRADGTGWADLAAAAPAVYVVCSPEAPPFTDVEKTDWFYTGVRYVSFCGLMTGTGAGLFAPRATATRAMLAEILYRMAGSPASEAENIFDDAASGAWYADAVRWAAGSGVISGYGDGRFGPEDPVTREQLAVLLARYAGSPAAETDYVGTFSDGGEASAYAVAALNWAVERGILTGRGDGTLDPAGIAGRAEIAAMLARFDAAGAGEASGAQAR